MCEPVNGSIYDRFKVWDRFRAQFLLAMESCHGSHNEDDVLVRIASGAYQIWDGETAATVTTIIEYPRLKVLNIFLAAGDMERMFALTAQSEKWAIRNGIARLISGGREGWLRKVQGAKSMGLLMYRDL